MRVLQNTTTEKLEAFARARGFDLGIMKATPNASGVFFVTRDNGQVLTYWISLGWTVEEAKERISNWE